VFYLLILKTIVSLHHNNKQIGIMTTTNVLVLVNSSNNEFIACLSANTNLYEWSLNWIENDDKDIDFYEGGNINIDRLSNEILIKGDNGLIIIDIKEFTL